MARPTQRGEAKSAILNIRITPTLKAKLEYEARNSGNTLAAECERRLVESMDETERPKLSPPTQDLITAIERAILQIEAVQGKGWCSGVDTWAAVQEMLSKGPIMQVTPDGLKGFEEDRLSDLFLDLQEQDDKRQGIIAALRTYLTNEQIAEADKTEPTGDRSELREAVEKLGLPEALLSKVLIELDELEKVDEEVRRLRATVDEMVQPIIDAIRAGQNLFEDRPEPVLPLAAAMYEVEMAFPNALMEMQAHIHQTPRKRMIAFHRQHLGYAGHSSSRVARRGRRPQHS